MKDIKKISRVVFMILTKNPAARDSDNTLYEEVCTFYNPHAMNSPFGYVLSHSKDLGIPKFESVRRARQKIQEKHEDLRSCKAVEDEKYESWKAVREYVSEG